MPALNDEAAVFEYVTMSGRNECWQWTGSWGGRDRNKRPYIQVAGKRWLAYRLVYTLVHGRDLTTEEMILHSCDNGQWPIGCCNPYHMRIGGHTENAVDMMMRQRHGLPRIVVKAIRRLLDAGRTHEEIAELYGVARSTVTQIASKRVYQQVELDNDGSSDTPSIGERDE